MALENIRKKSQTKLHSIENNVNLSKDAQEVLQILDNIELFTTSIRKKITKEISSMNRLIHVKLDSL